MWFRRMLGTHMNQKYLRLPIRGAAAFVIVLFITIIIWTSTASLQAAQAAPSPTEQTQADQRATVPQFSAADWAKSREQHEAVGRKIDWSQIAALVGALSTAFTFINRYLLSALKTEMLKEIDGRYQPRDY